MIHLGVNVYCWEEERQNRLLSECLVPAVAEIQRHLGMVRFWFDRFDARGPHVLTLVSLPRDGRTAALKTLSPRLDAFFASCPDGGTVSRAQIEKRHAACRSLALCQIDLEPGIAPNSSYCFFEHPHDGFPFHLGKGLPNELDRELWELAHSLSLWSVRQIALNAARPPVQTAIRWLSAFDWQLRRSHFQAERFWRFHSSTLLPSLSQRLQAEEREVLRVLPSVIGKKNTLTFSRIWAEMESSEPPWPSLPRFVECVLAQHQPSTANPWRLPRELIHSLLKQLCIHVAYELPLVLYAWSRNLSEGGCP